MKKSLHISVPKSCHEDWSKMTTTQKGKFCQVCTKEVVDFTHYSDEQLINYFNSNNNLCGRFTQQQLDRDLVLEQRRNRFFSRSLFIGLFSLFVLNSHTTKAQEKPKTEQTDKKYTSIPLKNTNFQKEITVSGIITDENNTPFPYVSLLIKGTSNGTISDFDGQYSLKCKKGDILQISIVGYDTQEKIINQEKLNIQLTYNEDLELLGEIVTVPLKKRWIGGNLFTRFTNIFRKDKKNPKFKPNHIN